MPNQCKKRAGIYARESRGKAKSVEDQIAAGLATVREEEWEHAGTWRDGSSASRQARKARDDWPEVLAALEAGELDVLVLWESSRGSREPVDWFGMLNTAMQRGVLIHIISHERTYDPRRARDWKVLADDGVDAAHETNRLSERTRRGTATAAAAGLPHGRVAYGYERVYDELTRKFIEQRPHPVRAPIVREIIVRIGKGIPVNTVLNELEARGVPAPWGSSWSRAEIRAICMNLTYIGKRKHRGELHEAVWPPLVTEEEFYAARSVLTAPGRKEAKPGQARWLLSYIATAPCGWGLKVNAAPRPKRSRQRPHYVCSLDGCAGLPMEDLDEVVARLITARFAVPEVRELFRGDTATAQAARDEAARLRADLVDARNRVGQRPPHGISPASLATIEANLAPLIAEADRRAARARPPGPLADLLDAAQLGREAIRPAWDSMAVASQRAVVSRLMTIQLRPLGELRRLSRWATEEQRLARAVARSEINWLSPGE